MAARVRSSRDSDVAAIAAIYDHHVLAGLASFEIEPPGYEEMRRRRAALIADGFPWLVAEVAGEVAGYAYAGAYRARPAYRYAVEDSIYLAPRFAGRGIGTFLLTALVGQCAHLGFRQMIAVIGDSANHASIRVHERCGFALVGAFRAVGFKHARWVDSVLMQRALGEGSASPPP